MVPIRPPSVRLWSASVPHRSPSVPLRSPSVALNPPFRPLSVPPRFPSVQMSDCSKYCSVLNINVVPIGVNAPHVEMLWMHHGHEKLVDTKSSMWSLLAKDASNMPTDMACARCRSHMSFDQRFSQQDERDTPVNDGGSWLIVADPPPFHLRSRSAAAPRPRSGRFAADQRPIRGRSAAASRPRSGRRGLL